MTKFKEKLISIVQYSTKGGERLLKKKHLMMPVLIIILGILLTLDITMSQSTTRVWTYPEPCTGNVDTNFDLYLIIEEVSELYMWQANMTFDPNILSVVDVVQGDFLGQAGPTTWGEKVNNTSGWVFAGASLSPPLPLHGANTTADSPAGWLATITFHVDLKGTSSLHFASETALFTWNFTLGQAVPIDFTPDDGVFEYPQAVEFVFALGKAYGSTGGPPPSTNWNPGVDFDFDNDVDDDDLIILSENYGQD